MHSSQWKTRQFFAVKFTQNFLKTEGPQIGNYAMDGRSFPSANPRGVRDNFFSCSFHRNFDQIIGWRCPLEMSPPGKSWIHHWLLTIPITHNPQESSSSKVVYTNRLYNIIMHSLALFWFRYRCTPSWGCRFGAARHSHTPASYRTNTASWWVERTACTP